MDVAVIGSGGQGTSRPLPKEPVLGTVKTIEEAKKLAESSMKEGKTGIIIIDDTDSTINELQHTTLVPIEPFPLRCADVIDTKSSTSPEDWYLKNHRRGKRKT